MSTVTYYFPRGDIFELICNRSRSISYLEIGPISLDGVDDYSIGEEQFSWVDAAISRSDATIRRKLAHLLRPTPADIMENIAAEYNPSPDIPETPETPEPPTSPDVSTDSETSTASETPEPPLSETPESPAPETPPTTDPSPTPSVALLFSFPLVYTFELTHSLQGALLPDALEVALVNDVCRQWLGSRNLRESSAESEASFDELKSISLMIENYSRPVCS